MDEFLGKLVKDLGDEHTTIVADKSRLLSLSER